MFRQYLDKISGVEVYPMFSMMVFFTFFIGLIWYVVKANKEEMDIISKLPLNNDKSENL
jgi:cytochrome c oxidase cbb3-type subunit IV